VNSLPKTVTRQRRDCDLNPGPSAPEYSTLTARLPSHPYATGRNYPTESQRVTVGRYSAGRISPRSVATQCDDGRHIAPVNPGSASAGVTRGHGASSHRPTLIGDLSAALQLPRRFVHRRCSLRRDDSHTSCGPPAWASTPLEHWEVAGRAPKTRELRRRRRRGVGSGEGLCPFPENLLIFRLKMV